MEQAPEAPEHSHLRDIRSTEIRPLPAYIPISRTSCSWQGLTGEEFGNTIDDAYSQIVHWIPNQFMLPSGNCGKQFVGELARLFEAYATESAIETFAIKAAMTMPTLLLQKPHSKSKSKDHITCLRRRLTLWENGDIAELLKEGKAIQNHVRTSSRRTDKINEARMARTFSKLMMEGKVRSAFRLLAKGGQSGILTLNQVSTGKTVKDILEEKHPDANPTHGEAILSKSNVNVDFHPILFENVNAEAIRAAALHTQGAAGPSGADAMIWRRLCTAFGGKSNDLCSALAACARRICTTYVDPTGLMAYTACRLIPLDKCPGVRPIGIGEVARRIIGKAIMKIAKSDLQKSVGSLQLCAGQDAGCEAAVHAMSLVFKAEETEAMIFVDASNAFNRLNRQAALRNSEVVCPTLAPVLINTYRNNSWLFVDGQCMMSREGTTQGDPLAMAMYAIGTQPLIHRLDGIAKQVWYADDSAAGSSVEKLKRWWDKLEMIGPQYGYFPNGSKTFVVCKPEAVGIAGTMFQGTGISISAEGRKYLGGVIGTSSFQKQLIGKKITEWVEEVKTLSTIAKTEPHAAFSAFTHGLSSKWNYFLRVTDFESLEATEQLQPLEDAVRTLFIPALTGHSPPGDLIRELLTLPPNLGGTGLINPLRVSADQYDTSKRISAPLVELVMKQDHQNGECSEAQRKIKATTRSEKQNRQKQSARNLLEQLPTPLQRSMELSQEKSASTWLTALPIENHGFALHKAAFRDALSLRYGWALKNTPSHCSCGHMFSIAHAMSCPTGGYPSIRHNEIRDITASLLTEVCHNVSIEPHLQPMTGESLSHRTANIEDQSRLDIAVCGFWGGRFEKAFFDVRVFNPSAQSNQQASLTSTYRRHELEKKRQYEQRIREVEHSTFTPLVLSSTGGMGRAATTFYKRLSSMLSERRDVPYSTMIRWVRCRLSFALLRASIMAIRGARSSRHRPAKDMLLELPVEVQAVEGHLGRN